MSVRKHSDNQMKVILNKVMAMKKTVLSVCFGVMVIFAGVAQEMEIDGAAAAKINKRGIELLPKAGDFAMGIDAMPFLNYLGGMLSGAGRSGIDVQGYGFNENTFYGKYFLSRDEAIRAKFWLLTYNELHKNAVADDYELHYNPLNLDATAIDMMTNSMFGSALSLGYELRRGRGRVQGFGGGEAILLFVSEKTKFDWANTMTEVNQIPSSSAGLWGAGSEQHRTLEINKGNTFGGGVGGFVGVEYFFTPMISVGCEFNLTFIYSATQQSEKATEYWDTATNRLQNRHSRSYEDQDWGHRKIDFKTSPGNLNAKGGIYLMFHF